MKLLMFLLLLIHVDDSSSVSAIIFPDDYNLNNYPPNGTIVRVGFDVLDISQVGVVDPCNFKS